MAINLNHLQYGAQFKAFADFAAGQRDENVARETKRTIA